MKYSILLLAILLFAPLHASASSCNTLQVSGYTGWVPLLIQDSEEDPLTGIAIGLIREIATDLKLPIEFKILPWKRSLQYLEKAISTLFSASTKPSADQKYTIIPSRFYAIRPGYLS